MFLIVLPWAIALNHIAKASGICDSDLTRGSLSSIRVEKCGEGLIWRPGHKSKRVSIEGYVINKRNVIRVINDRLSHFRMKLNMLSGKVVWSLAEARLNRDRGGDI